MDELIRLLHEGGYSCVIRKEEIRTFTQRGVADLYDLLNQHPVFLHGAQVADKVVGKAAAALMVLGVSGRFIRISSVSLHWLYCTRRILGGVCSNSFSYLEQKPDRLVSFGNSLL